MNCAGGSLLAMCDRAPHLVDLAAFASFPLQGSVGARRNVMTARSWPPRVRGVQRVVLRFFRRSMIAASLGTSFASAIEAQALDAFLPRARRLMREAPFIDTHNDLPYMSGLKSDFDLERYDPDKTLSDIDTDLPRAAKGLVGAHSGRRSSHRRTRERAGTMVIEQIDMIHRMTARSPRLAFATTADDIVRIHRQGKIAWTTCRPAHRARAPRPAPTPGRVSSASHGTRPSHRTYHVPPLPSGLLTCPVPSGHATWSLPRPSMPSPPYSP
jgi:hypothetical protein